MAKRRPTLGTGTAAAGAADVPRAAHGAALVRDVPLIEREDELRTLGEALESTRAGAGRMVLIDGDVGVGKTRLLSAAVGMARARGMLTLTAASDPLEREFAFGVVLQAFERALPREPSERVAALDGAGSLAACLFAPSSSTPVVTAPDELHRLFQGLAVLVGDLAHTRPLVLAVDDAHWSDGQSLRFLHYLARRLAELPIAVIMAARFKASSAADLMSGLRTHADAGLLAPEPLTAAGTSALVEAVLPEALADFRQAVWEATLGNPLLVFELVRELRERKMPPATVSVDELLDIGPPGVARLVAARLGGEGTAAFAGAVALLGEDATLRRSARLAGIDVETAALAREKLVGAGLIEDGEPPRLRHPLVRACLGGEVNAGDRAGARLAVAELLHHESAAPERVAGHLVAAQTGGRPWVVETLRGAAEQALERGEPALAMRYLRRALDEPPEPGTRPRVLLELGSAAAVAGDAAAVAPLLEAAELFSDPRDVMGALLIAGRTLYVQGRHAEATEALERGLEGPAPGAPEMRAKLGAARAAVTRLGLSGRPEPATSVLEDDPVDGSTLARLACDAAFRGQSREEVRRLAEQALGAGELLAQETADGPSYYLASLALIVADELAAAEVALTLAVEDARARGSVMGFATASLFRGLAILRRGRVAEAAGDAENALGAVRHGWRLASSAAQGLLAMALLERNEVEAATRELESVAVPEPAELGFAFFLAARGRLSLLRGDAQVAHVDFLAAGRRLDAAGAPNPALLPWRSGAALAAGALGDREQALALAEAELALARTFGAAGATGIALRTRAALERRPARRLELLEEAVDLLESSPAALDRARALTDLGAVLRRTNRRAASRSPLRRALDLADGCGATALAARVHDELVATGARPRRAALSGAGALTPRERQIADLAAQGMRNGDIARALFITPKTVEWHLANTYAKLDVSSRRELLSALTRRGARDDELVGG